MSTENKAQNAAEQLSGKVKEAAGKLTGNDQKVAEGKTEQKTADLKQAGENVKDAFIK